MINENETTLTGIATHSMGAPTTIAIFTDHVEGAIRLRVNRHKWHYTEEAALTVEISAATARHFAAALNAHANDLERRA